LSANTSTRRRERREHDALARWIIRERDREDTEAVSRERWSGDELPTIKLYAGWAADVTKTRKHDGGS
jgi:hypothetical protein